VAKGINIEFLSDVRRFLSGTKDVTKSLDDVADALDDLSRDAQRTGDKMGESLEGAGDGAKDAGRKIGDEIEDGTDKAEDAAKGLERKFRNLFDDVGGSARKAGTSIGDDIKRGTDKASDGVDNFKEESRDTAREVAASFDGSAESIAGGFQEVLANAFIGFGPAGAAAGIAAAAGAGLFLNEWTKRTEAAKVAVSSMYEDMLESGNRFLSAQYVNEGISKILNDDEEAVIKYAEAQRIAAQTGLDLATVVRGYSGDAEAAAVVQAELRAEQEKFAGVNTSTNAVLNGYIDTLNGVTENTATAAEKADVYTGAMQTTAEAVIAYDQALGGMSESLATATEQIKTNNDTLAVGEERTRANNAVLADLAEELGGVSSAAAAAGVKGAELNRVQQDQYGAFMAAATAAGITKDAANRLADQYGLMPGSVSTTVSAPGVESVIDAVSRLRGQLAELHRTQGVYVVSENVTGSTGRASGGPVEGGSYLVGEHGPEVVSINGKGSVTPNVNVTAGGTVRLDQQSINALAAALDAHAARRSVQAVADKTRAVRLAGTR